MHNPLLAKPVLIFVTNITNCIRGEKNCNVEKFWLSILNLKNYGVLSKFRPFFVPNLCGEKKTNMRSVQSKCTCDELFAHPPGLNLKNQAEQFNSACELKAATSQNVGVGLHSETQRSKVHSQRVIKKLTSTLALQGVQCAPL